MLAESYAEEILAFLEKHGTQGIEHPAVVYLSCYHILRTILQPKRATKILEQGQQYMEHQLSQIDDPALQQSYREGIPEYQEFQKILSSG
jgi:hypothetical protein